MTISLKNSLRYSSDLLTNALSFFSARMNNEGFHAENAANEFYNSVKKGIKNGEIIFGFPLIWMEDVLIDGAELTQKDANIYLNLNSFFQELKKIATIKYVENGEGFTRMANPPKEAYEYKGHNKLDIKPSKLASALFYED